MRTASASRGGSLHDLADALQVLGFGLCGRGGLSIGVGAGGLCLNTLLRSCGALRLQVLLVLLAVGFLLGVPSAHLIDEVLRWRLLTRSAGFLRRKVAVLILGPLVRSPGATNGQIEGCDPRRGITRFFSPVVPTSRRPVVALAVEFIFDTGDLTFERVAVRLEIGCFGVGGISPGLGGQPSLAQFLAVALLVDEQQVCGS